MVNKALEKATIVGAKEKVIYLKGIYNELNDIHMNVHPGTLKSVCAEIDITAGIFNHDKALFDKGIRNYKNALMVPPSPAFRGELTLHNGIHVNGPVNDGKYARTSTTVQATDAVDIANMRNKSRIVKITKDTAKSWAGIGGRTTPRRLAFSCFHAPLNLR